MNSKTETKMTPTSIRESLWRQLRGMTPGERQYQWAKWANICADPLSPAEEREYDDLRETRSDAVRDLQELVTLASNMGHTKDDQLAWALLTDMLRQRVERLVPRSLKAELNAMKADEMVPTDCIKPAA